jgi:hypothetical protein
MTIGGAAFNQGDLIPRAAAASEREYRRWFDTRRITAIPPTELEKVKRPRVPKAMKEIATGAPEPVAAVPPVASEQLQAAVDALAEDLVIKDGMASLAPGAGSGGGGEPADALTPVEEQAADEAATADIPADDPNGVIEAVGRGWYNVHYRGETKKVRTAEKAHEALVEMRGEAGEGKGTTILATVERSGEIVDPETGEIHEDSDGAPPWEQARETEDA